MSEQVGRAGFKVTHTKNASDRGAILHEMMRELDEESIAYWSDRNPNIVVADEALNLAFVNDGQGGFRRCSDCAEVIAYGNERLSRVHRKITPPKLDPVTGEMKGGTTTTTMVVSHLPKSLCVEVKDFYPRLYRRGPKKGQPRLDAEGNPTYRSRWVARDRTEAVRYFDDVRDILCSMGSPGGQAGMLGIDYQFSESTPHAQFLLDAFGEDPKHEGSLRADGTRFWFTHEGRLSAMHDQLKKELIARDWDISPDFDAEHTDALTKADYEELQDRRAELDTRSAELDQREDEIEEDFEIARKQRSAAARDGYADGKAQGLAQGAQEAAESLRERESAVAQREQQLGRDRLTVLEQQRRLRDEQEQLAADKERLTRRLEQAKIIASGNEAEYHNVLAKINVEHRRWLMRPALFESWLDMPMKSGKTLRSAYERFVEGASTSQPSAVPRPKQHPLPEVTTAVPGDTDAPEV